MAGPYDAGRDSNNPGFGFGMQGDIADGGGESQLDHGFGQTTGHLSEQDYRDADAKP